MANMTINTSDASTTVSPEAAQKSPPSKVVVAKSDFESAIQAIDNVMEKEFLICSATTEAASAATTGAPANFMRAEICDEQKGTSTNTIGDEHHEEVNNKNQNDNNDANQHSDTAKDEFLRHVHNSLKQRLYQIVTPIPDEEFQKRVRAPFLQEQINQENEQEEYLLQQQEEAWLAEEEAERHAELIQSSICNTDYDEQELLDEEALKRARELRSQVRTMASRMKQQQESIIERAIQIARREVRLLTEDILLCTADGDEGENKEQSIAKQAIYNARRATLKQVESTLQSLTDSLTKAVDGVIPKNIRDLKDTISVIEKSLEKKNKPESLSQTEKAIVSRNNEGECRDTGRHAHSSSIFIEEDDFSDMSNPEFILADFLSRY